MDSKENNVLPDDIKKIILNIREPVIIQNLSKCNLTSWNLKNWQEMIGDELLKFRCGKYQYTIDSQWESTCSIKKARFQEFLDNFGSNSDEWWYFDYKYLHEWFTDKEILRQEIDWSVLGFPEITANESTIWIGSKGAHTPCHKDSYGCNLILQVYGRKQWILFPPEQNLKPTRIPFEESSIYSKLNFFSPKEEDFRGISHCRKVILNPGDVLVLPNKWWHYVENLETAISINVWLPLPQDDMERIKESIATIFVGQMARSTHDYQDIILNPNMIEEMVTSDEALDIIRATLDKDKPVNKILKVINQTKEIEKETEDIAQYLAKYKCITKIPELNDKEFMSFLCSQSQRFSVKEKFKEKNINVDCKKVTDFLEVVTDDEVLCLIAKKLIEKRSYRH